MVVNYTRKFPCLVVFCLFQKAKFKDNVIPKHKRGKDF